MKSYRFWFWLLAGLGLLLDQTSKYVIFGYLDGKDTLRVRLDKPVPLAELPGVDKVTDYDGLHDDTAIVLPVVSAKLKLAPGTDPQHLLEILKARARVLHFEIVPGGEFTVIDNLFKIEATYKEKWKYSKDGGRTWTDEASRNFDGLAYGAGERWETGSRLDWLRTLSSDHVPRVNKGALFGIGHGHNWLFAAVSFAAAFLIIHFSRRPAIYHDRFLCLALGLILAGTLGNLYDRLVFDGVRDFVHWFIWDAKKNGYFFDWPVFNLADCCLVVGAGTLLIHAFFAADPATQQTVAQSEQESAVAP